MKISFHFQIDNIRVVGNLRPNVEIGNDCIIATSAVIKSHTKIGKHSIFGTLSNSEGSVEIGSWTTIQSQILAKARV